MDTKTIVRLFEFVNEYYNDEALKIKDDTQYGSHKKKMMLARLELQRKESIVNTHTRYLNSN